MKLYLVQHGKPVSKEEDPERPLSYQGADDIKRVAEFLEKYGMEIEEVLHSGKMRARQTAEIMISRLNPRADLIEREGLAPMDDVKDIARHLKERERDLMLVGHLPHLAKLASLLILGSETPPVVTFQQGGVLCLSKDKTGKWTIAWMLVPEII